jgi:hypothetical protein
VLSRKCVVVPFGLIGVGLEMIKIDTSPIRYFSYFDEKSFFEWAQSIPCISSVDGGFLHIKSKRLSEQNLRDLIAIMYRYKLPMQQLQKFCNSSNEHWFKSSKMFWFKPVFSPTSGSNRRARKAGPAV